MSAPLPPSTSMATVSTEYVCLMGPLTLTQHETRLGVHYSAANASPFAEAPAVRRSRGGAWPEASPKLEEVIAIPALRAVVMGDLFARKWAPLVDAGNGGSMLAYPETLARAVEALKDVDTVITGHSTTTNGTGQSATFTRSNPVMRWADLQEYADYTRAFVAAARAALN